MKKNVFALLAGLSISYSTDISPYISSGFNLLNINQNTSIGPSANIGVLLNNKHSIDISSIFTLSSHHIIGWGAGYQYNILSNKTNFNFHIGMSLGVWFHGKLVNTPYVFNPNQNEEVSTNSLAHFSEAHIKFEAGKKRLMLYLSEKVFLGKKFNNNLETGVTFYFKK